MLQSKVDHSKCAKHTPNAKHESSRGVKNVVVRLNLVISETTINRSNIPFFLSQIIRYGTQEQHQQINYCCCIQICYNQELII